MLSISALWGVARQDGLRELREGGVEFQAEAVGLNCTECMRDPFPCRS